MATRRESLSELAFVEREMSWLADEAAERAKDPGLAARMRRLRDEHESAAARFSGALAAPDAERPAVTERVRDRVRGLQRRVRSARDQTALLESVLEAEKVDVELHQAALAGGLPEDTGALVREQLAVERAHVRSLEEPDDGPRRL